MQDFRPENTTNKSHNQGSTFNVLEFADNLSQGEQGIWFSGNTAACSYPEDGQDRYFAIENDSFWFRHRNNAIIAAVKRFPPDGFILDIGGANGYVTLGLENNGFDAVLLEPSVAGARNARKRGLGQVICSTVADAGFRDNTVPAIGLFDVLEHIEDQTGFLKDVKRILVPEGCLYLTVPAYKALWSMEDNYAKHFRRYTLSRISRTLQTSGYTIDYATYLFSYLPVPLFFARTLPARLGLAKASTAEDARRENVIKSKITNAVISVFHALELRMIKRKMLVPFGGSLLVAAHSNT